MKQTEKSLLKGTTKMNQDDIKDFPHPLNEWIEEEVVVQKNKYDKDTGKIYRTHEIEKVKTKYFHAPPERIRCPKNDHYFVSFDPKKWLFVCKNCKTVKKVFPSHKLADGKIVPRKLQ